MPEKEKRGIAKIFNLKENEENKYYI